MSDAMERTLWNKIRYTPLRDAARGRLTARLDLRRALDDTDLPPDTRDLILRVVRKTRLWRFEQVDVMKELVAHFVDATASGKSSEAAIAAFGDPERAATLIRRAVRRNRSMPWQALRAAGWSALALLVFYGGFAIYFFTGQPSPKVNYVARRNQSMEQNPLENRAWPLYRRALLGTSEVWRSPLRFLVSNHRRPGSEGWPEMVERLGRYKTELGWIREGATKAVVGFVIGPGGSADDPELWPGMETTAATGPAGQPLANVRIPHLLPMSKMALLLGADAALAREQRDSKRFVQDVTAMLGLSRQMREEGPLLAAMVSLSIYDAALEEIDQTLLGTPVLLPDSDWVQLAHRLSGPRVAGDVLRTEFEEMNFADLLQRWFTDDGAGDGRLAWQGVTHAIPLAPMNSSIMRSPWMKTMLDPAAGLIVASRGDLAREYARLMDHVNANLRRPLREADWQTGQPRAAAGRISLLRSFRYLLIDEATPLYRHQHAVAERFLGHKEGLLTGIALELYRRRHGRYPGSLDQLVPELLPEVPADRISGEPVRYRLEGGRPVIYSVGADRKDDAGRAALNAYGKVSPSAAAQWEDSPGPVPSGDWVLYPRPQ